MYLCFLHVQEDDSPGNAAGSPSAEIKFAGFLCSLVSRQAFINGEAANFLKQNKLLPPGTTAMTWIQQRGCLFRVVDQQWVAMQRLHPGEGKEVFLDRVSSCSPAGCAHAFGRRTCGHVRCMP